MKAALATLKICTITGIPSLQHISVDGVPYVRPQK